MAERRYAVRVKDRRCWLLHKPSNERHELVGWQLADARRLVIMLNRGINVVREAKRDARTNP